jgi:hypothetical protein
MIPKIAAGGEAVRPMGGTSGGGGSAIWICCGEMLGVSASVGTPSGPGIEAGAAGAAPVAGRAAGRAGAAGRADGGMK